MSGSDEGDAAGGGPSGDAVASEAPGDGDSATGSERVQVTGTASDDYAGDPGAARETDDEFGWRGYVLLGVIAVAFVIAPVVVYLRPPALPRYVTLIIFPLLPAVGLGLVAVWSAAQS